MFDQPGAGRTAVVQFTGQRSELFGILVRGYLAMVPTIGLYRFWLITFKRRFYWSHTEIDGDALEYTGNARQLLIGFLIALAFFLPVYGVFFYLSTQGPTAALIGYGVLGTLLWFVTGYASYRARDFRLSRTLWRGIRFGQKGNAWAYAVRRFLWSLLMVVTLGLAYPAMAGNLWRYAYNNTWYGDRPFASSATWKTIAAPFYGSYAFIALLLLACGLHYVMSDVGGKVIVGFEVALTVLVAWLAYFRFRAREVSLLGSTVTCGVAALKVQIKGRALLGQFLVYVLASIGCLIIALAIGALVFTAMLAPLFAEGGAPTATEVSHLMRANLLNIVVIVLGYLAFLASLAAMAELFLGLGFWKLVANNTTVGGIDTLADVRPGAEDNSLGGEGLADALNVGAY